MKWKVTATYAITGYAEVSKEIEAETREEAYDLLDKEWELSKAEVSLDECDRVTIDAEEIK